MRTTLSAIIFCTVFISVFSLSQSASAATMVIGVNGSSHGCYDAANIGDPNGIQTCNAALSEPLLPHDRAATLINRSALRIETGDYKGGLADCDESIRIFAGLGEAELNRGVALRAMGHPRAALEAFDKAIDIGLIRPQLAYYDRALADEDVGDVAGAYHDYKMALQLEPGFGLAASQLTRFKITITPNTPA